MAHPVPPNSVRWPSGSPSRIQQENAFNVTCQTRYPPVIGVVGYYSVPETTTGFVLPRARHLTGKENYLSVALAAAQYSAGANPMNMTFTIGVGHDHPRRVLHLDSRNAGIEPPDSITVYGQTDPALTNGSVIDCWRVRRPHCMMSYADLRRHHECVDLTSRLSEFLPRLGKLLNLMPVRPKPGRGLQADRGRGEDDGR